MDNRRTFNGTIPEPNVCFHEPNESPSVRWVTYLRYKVDMRLQSIKIDKLEQELRRQQRINRMLCRVIEDQAIKVTLKGVEG